MLQLTSGVYQELIGYCMSELPQEACGVLSARDGIVQTCWPILNRDRSANSFTMDEAELETVLVEIERSGELLAAIFHSHPNATAKPSQFDIEHIVLPCSYVIVSLLHHRPRVRSYLPVNQTLQPQRIILHY